MLQLGRNTVNAKFRVLIEHIVNVPEDEEEEEEKKGKEKKSGDMHIMQSIVLCTMHQVCLYGNGSLRCKQ